MELREAIARAAGAAKRPKVVADTQINVRLSKADAQVLDQVSEHLDLSSRTAAARWLLHHAIQVAAEEVGLQP